MRLSSASRHTSNSNRYETGTECTHRRASDAYSVTGAVDPHCKPMVVVTYFESLFLLCIFRSRHVRGHRSLGLLSEWRSGTAGLQKGQQPSGSRQRWHVQVDGTVSRLQPWEELWVLHWKYIALVPFYWYPVRFLRGEKAVPIENLLLLVTLPT